MQQISSRYLTACALIAAVLIACSGDDQAYWTLISPRLAALLPSCPEAAAAARTDIYLGGVYSMNPFAGAAASPVRRRLPLPPEAVASSGLRARYERECAVVYRLGPLSSVQVRTTVDRMDSEAAAQSGLNALPGHFDGFEVWIHPIDGQRKYVSDPAFAAIAKEISGLYVASYAAVGDLSRAGAEEDVALREEWVAAWRAGAYVIIVRVSVQDRNFLTLSTAHGGVVSSRTFDGWHVTGRLALRVLNGWQFGDGARSQIKLPYSNLGAILNRCGAVSRQILQERFPDRLPTEVSRETSGVQLACAITNDPGRRTELELRAARAGTSVCDVLLRCEAARLPEEHAWSALHEPILDGVVIGCTEYYENGRSR